MLIALQHSKGVVSCLLKKRREWAWAFNSYHFYCHVFSDMATYSKTILPQSIWFRLHSENP